MPYLNLDLDYFTHPKVIRLVGLLGPEHIAVPIRLWCYVGKYHCATGMLEAYSIGELESAVNWMGEPGLLVEALLKIKFIDKIKNGYRIHDWLDHAGHLVAFKKRAKTAANKRWDALATSNAISTPQSKITNTPNHPNQPSHPNQPKKRKSNTHPMPDNWILNVTMTAYAASKGMTPVTFSHEFEHCKMRHGESRFTDKGWASQVWQTWVLNWVKFGKKQVVLLEPSLPKSFRKLDTIRSDHHPMPDDVRILLAQAGKGKGMPT
jgi:hypothetical protein